MDRGSYSTEQMIALHGLLAEGAALGEAGLSELSGCETSVEVAEVRCGPLEEFGVRGLRLGDDLAAAVTGRVEGGVTGSLALVLDPEDALVWLRTAGSADPLEAFVALGRVALEGIAAALAEVMRTRIAFSGARLVEATEPGLLAGTHAPSDTIVVSARLRIAVRDESLAAAAHLLIEPKHFARLLTALSAALH